MIIMGNKRGRHTPEQIIRKLAEGHKLLAAGQDLEDVCRHLEIAESTWHRWLAQYGGMKANDAKRLRELEGENGRLSHPPAHHWKLLTPNRKRSAVVVLRVIHLVTGPTSTATAGVALGSNHLWPPTARHATPAEVASAFAREVLGWDTASANVFEEGDASGPVWVRLVQPGAVELVDVLTVPVSDGRRVIIEIGAPWAKGVSVESIAPGQDGSRIELIRVAGAMEAELSVLLDSGRLEPIAATGLDIRTGRIDIATIADPAAIRSILILYRDDRGRVIAATGASFGSESRDAEDATRVDGANDSTGVNDDAPD